MKRRTFLTTSAAAAATAALPRIATAQGLNPIIAPWTGPFGGVPAFDKIKTADFAPGMETAMNELRSEIRAITVVRSAPTFENTLKPLENSGRTLDRAST